LKRKLHERKTEHFKALLNNDHSSAVADHDKNTGHNIKWDHFDILAPGKTDYHCKFEETLFIQELQLAINDNAALRNCYFISIGFPLFISFYGQFPFETS